jgi:hypothetical protein
MMTALYNNPVGAIVAVSCVHATYLSIAIYCEPYERKYIRVHFYLTEAAKMFMFISLINFTTLYTNQTALLDITVIFYGLLAFIFGMHLFFLLIAIWVEWKVYKHFCFKKFCKEDYPEVD